MVKEPCSLGTVKLNTGCGDFPTHRIFLTVLHVRKVAKWFSCEAERAAQVLYFIRFFFADLLEALKKWWRSAPLASGDMAVLSRQHNVTSSGL